MKKKKKIPGVYVLRQIRLRMVGGYVSIVEDRKKKKEKQAGLGRGFIKNEEVKNGR